MAATIFLDERGDLGWSFDAPYRKGGSSRFSTLAAVVLPDALKHLPARAVRELYTQRKWATDKEKKWSNMSDGARLAFATLAKKLKDQQPQIKLCAITVDKQRVNEHLRSDPNLLYNYMLRKMLAQEMAKYAQVQLVPDPRSIKVASANSQHEYLQIYLWYELGVHTKLSSNPKDSKHELGIQFADMLSGVVQSHFEDQRAKAWCVLENMVELQTLFFD